jgi:hypothetical protein
MLRLPSEGKIKIVTMYEIVAIDNRINSSFTIMEILNFFNLCDAIIVAEVIITM